MWANRLVVVLSAAIALAPHLAQSQGLPDIVWETDDHTRTVEGVAYAPDGSYVVSGAETDDCSVRLWRAADGWRLGDFSVSPHGIRSVDVTPDLPLVAVGYIVSGYPPGGVAAVWDAELGEELYTTGGCYVSLSPGGEMLASGGGGVNRYLSLTEVPSGIQRHSIYTGGYIADVAYSPSGRAVATCSSTDNAIKLWDPATGGLIRTLTGHTDDVSAIAFSSDGTLLASGAGGWDDPGESTIKVWRVSDGELLDTLDGHGEWVHAVAFAPEGDVLVSSGRTGPTQKIKFWDLGTGEMTRYYDDSAHDIDFSPDGQYFVYGRLNGDVVLARSGLLSGVDDPAGPASALAFAAPSPNPLSVETDLRFSLGSPGETRLEIYDVRGRRVATLLSGMRPAGEHSVRWDGRDDGGSDVASGIYFARLVAGEETAVRKMVMLK